MKKFLLFAFVLGIVMESYAQLVDSRTILTSYEQPVKKEKRREWKFRAGLSASTLTGKDTEDADYDTHAGYQLGFEFRRFTKTNVFWGMEFNFASRGTKNEVEVMKEDGGHYSYGYWVPNYTTSTEDAKITCHEFEWVPINLGYRYDINSDIAVSSRIGVFVNAIMVGNYKVGDEDAVDIFDDEEYGGPERVRANAGIKWGIGAQWKHLALDFEIQRSFAKAYEDVKAYERAFNLTVGYIF